MWDFAPPSDHEAKSYLVPPRIWGDRAMIVLVEPTITRWA